MKIVKSPGAWIFVAAVALIAVVAITASESDSADDADSSTAAELSPQERRQHDELSKLARLDADDPRALGVVDAPVVMIEYADFQCGFCAQFAAETKPELIERFVDEGHLRIEWRDFPLKGEDSTVAAHAGYAAAQQDRFWQFHDGLYAFGEDFSEDDLVEVAAEAGVDDAEQFQADMESSQADAAVQIDYGEASGIGITGTPAFLVNGRPIMGAQPTETFVELVEDALHEDR